MTCASPPSAILTRRCLRSPRTQPTDHSSQKSSLPSRMSSSQTPAATWYLGRRIFCHRKFSSLSDVFRDYLSVKVWDLHMESKPIETFTVHEYLRSKLCSLYENDCIFDKFEVGRLINHNSGRLNDCIYNPNSDNDMVDEFCCSVAGMERTLRSWPVATTTSSGRFSLWKWKFFLKIALFCALAQHC